jgi:hypothetical protein
MKILKSAVRGILKMPLEVRNNRKAAWCLTATLALAAYTKLEAVQDYYWVAVTNKATNCIEIYDPQGYADWSVAGAKKWSWKPTTALGYTSAEVDKWNNGSPVGNPMDHKIRNNTYWAGSTQVAASVGGEIATVCRLTGGTKGQKLWATNTGANSYPHSIEVLPNGNVAVACTFSGNGGWVRVYNTGGSNYAQFNLNWAHGVLWDPANSVLWVAGDLPAIGSVVTALVVGGDKDTPTLTEDTARRSVTPTGGVHDISAYFYDTDLLWVTTKYGVYKYRKSTKTFTASPGASFRNNVKAISNQGIGQIVQACSDVPGKVYFYDGVTGALNGIRTIPGGADLYKADVWAFEYQ